MPELTEKQWELLSVVKKLFKMHMAENLCVLSPVLHSLSASALAPGLSRSRVRPLVLAWLGGFLAEAPARLSLLCGVAWVLADPSSQFA